jgi:hypothetical protein
MLYRSTLLLALAALLFNCEDTVAVPSDFEEGQLVVEAWLTDQPQEQVINLTLSQDFFGAGVPPRVEGATVVVCQDTTLNSCRFFTERDPGEYVWTPTAPDETLGEVGQEFFLGIELGEDRYVSSSTMQRVPEIDSISFYFEEEQLGVEEGFYAQLYAKDPPGRGDAYFIRSFHNDTLLIRPFEFALAYDATFSPGADADGTTFIFPIRFSINRLDEDGAPQALNPEDRVEVELWSLTDEAFLFLTVAQEQVQNGGIFAVPLANAPGNVINVDTQEPVLGFFHVAAVSEAERTFTGN